MKPQLRPPPPSCWSRRKAPTGLPGQEDGCPALIPFIKAPVKWVSRQRCPGRAAGPWRRAMARDGARLGRAMRRRFALRTGRPMKGVLGPSRGREARRYPTAAGPSRPNERNSAPREEAGAGQVFLPSLVAMGPGGGKPAELLGLAPVPGWDPLPGGALPPSRFCCLCFGKWENAHGSTHVLAPRG